MNAATTTAQFDAWGVPTGALGNHEITLAPGFADGYASGYLAGHQAGAHTADAETARRAREQVFAHLQGYFTLVPLRTFDGADILELLGQRRAAAAQRAVIDRAREQYWKQEEARLQRLCAAELDYAAALRDQAERAQRLQIDADTPEAVKELACRLRDAYWSSCSRATPTTPASWKHLSTEDAQHWAAAAREVLR